MAVKDLASRPEAAAASAREIANRYGIPVELMAKVLQRLVRQGLLASHHGTRGGYLLSRSASRISVADVIEAIDGQRFKGSLEYWTAEFRFRIQSIRPGTRIELTVSRGAQLLKLPVTVGQPSKQQMQSIMRTQSVDRWWDTVLDRVFSRRQNDLPAVHPE